MTPEEVDQRVAALEGRFQELEGRVQILQSMVEQITSLQGRIVTILETRFPEEAVLPTPPVVGVNPAGGSSIPPYHW
jgi:hypothetical protein